MPRRRGTLLPFQEAESTGSYRILHDYLSTATGPVPDLSPLSCAFVSVPGTLRTPRFLLAPWVRGAQMSFE